MWVGSDVITLSKNASNFVSLLIGNRSQALAYCVNIYIVCFVGDFRSASYGFVVTLSSVLAD